jgi:hypothetical protein
MALGIVARITTRAIKIAEATCKCKVIKDQAHPNSITKTIPRPNTTRTAIETPKRL